MGVDLSPIAHVPAGHPREVTCMSTSMAIQLDSWITNLYEWEKWLGHHYAHPSIKKNCGFCRVQGGPPTLL